MKTKLSVFSIFVALVAAAAFSTTQPVLAQAGCTDAAGNPIPCPPTKVKNTAVPPIAPTATPTATATAPSTSTAEPTSTTLPISNPTGDGSSTEVTWTGTCGGPDESVWAKCITDLTDACDAAGGSNNMVTDNSGTTTFTCTLPLILEPTSLPLGAAPTSTSLPDEGYLGQCTEADGDFFDCAEQFICEDGLLVIKVDLYSGHGTVYDFYCIPDEAGPIFGLPTPAPGGRFPPGGWLPWITGLTGLIVGMLLPAIQKAREAAQRAHGNGEEEGYMKKAKRAEAEMPPAPQSREHILLNNDDGVPTDDEGMQLRSKRAEIPSKKSPAFFDVNTGDNATGGNPPPPPSPKN